MRIIMVMMIELIRFRWNTVLTVTFILVAVIAIDSIWMNNQYYCTVECNFIYNNLCNRQMSENMHIYVYMLCNGYLWVFYYDLQKNSEEHIFLKKNCSQGLCASGIVLSLSPPATSHQVICLLEIRFSH